MTDINPRKMNACVRNAHSILFPQIKNQISTNGRRDKQRRNAVLLSDKTVRPTDSCTNMNPKNVKWKLQNSQHLRPVSKTPAPRVIKLQHSWASNSVNPVPRITPARGHETTCWKKRYRARICCLFQPKPDNQPLTSLSYSIY